MLELNNIYGGDCLTVMKNIDDNSIDTIITDPPYGMSFMGKKWDYDVPSLEVWKECLRVLKPGGTALIFAGSRTQHRMAVNVEDAGFILKDCIMWLYGSGFPKAMDISKELDKKAGAERKIVGSRQAHDIRNNNLMEASQGKNRGKMEYHYTVPTTEEAKIWNGWKSHGLKPAYEPILVAMKPNDGNYVENALKHGVSGLNIDEARIQHNEEIKKTTRESGTGNAWNDSNCGLRNGGEGLASANPEGRFPANIILDEEAASLLDQQTGNLKSGSNCVRTKEGNFCEHGGLGKAGDVQKTYGDSGGASRFFYCAKASSSERESGLEGKNSHPTVKPLKLIEYLCTLTKTPTGGIVLDPFAGSGTTGLAAKNTNRSFILIEKESEYVQIAKKRMEG